MTLVLDSENTGRGRRLLILLTTAVVAFGSVTYAQVPYEVTHTFDGRFELGVPSNTIMEASNGDFYLTAARGGAHRQGSIFRMTPSGLVTPLHSFSGAADGSTPFGPLVQGVDGNLYGTTEHGGASDSGRSSA